MGSLLQVVKYRNQTKRLRPTCSMFTLRADLCERKTNVRRCTRSLCVSVHCAGAVSGDKKVRKWLDNVFVPVYTFGRAVVEVDKGCVAVLLYRWQQSFSCGSCGNIRKHGRLQR